MNRCDEILGGFLRLIRRYRGKSIRSMGHLSVAYISELERGKKGTTVATLEKYAKGLGLVLVVGFRDEKGNWWLQEIDDGEAKGNVRKYVSGREDSESAGRGM